MHLKCENSGFDARIIFHEITGLVNYTGKLKQAVVSKEAVAAIMLVAGIVGLFASHSLHVR